MVHALTAANELAQAGEDVKLLFEGIGVTWLDAFHHREHPFTQRYGTTFDAIMPHIMGACNFCTVGRFEVGDAVSALGLDLLGAEGDHFSVGTLISDGYQVMTF